MAFTGNATIVQVSDRKVRITGLSLAADASGTIGFDGSGKNVELPPLPGWIPYANGHQVEVSLQSAIEVRTQPTTDVGVSVPVSCVKTGTDQSDFQIALHNDLAGGGQISGELEIYIEFH